MKKRIGVILAALLSVWSLLLPVGAAAVLQSPLLETARTRITESVGVDTAGAAVGIYVAGEPLMLEGFGYADISADALVTPDTVFEIGDLSAVFVALAAYRLAQQGTLSLTDSIEDYLPADFYANLGLSHPVTVEQLLLGCAGFEARTFDLVFKKESHRFDTLEKALLAEVPAQIAEPSTFYAYSPFGIALAAYTVQCASGQDYAEYVYEEILSVLGMKHTVLAPDAATETDKRASGHVAKEPGVFAVCVEGGRSYAGLYPANGAISTPEDMGLLLSFLQSGNAEVLSDAARVALLETVYENGIFSVSAPALSVRRTALGRTDETLHFGASLWMDLSRGIGAFVLTNTAGSSLLDLPAELCGTVVGETAEVSGAMLELETLEGVYVTAESESDSFVGRMLRKENGMEAVAAEDGTLGFLGMRLKQIAAGVFADADSEENVAVVQFLLNADGEVERVVTADGNTYLPVSFFEKELPANVLFYAMMILTVGFLFAGILSLVSYLMTRYDRTGKGFIYTLPLLFATLMSVFVLLQIWVGIEYGAAAFSSFFEVFSVLTLLASIGAIVGFLLAFAASLTHRKMPARVARSAVLFIVFLLLVNYWGLAAL